MDYNYRLNNIGTSAIRDFDEKVRNIEGMLNFTIGEPDFNLPENIKAAFKRAIDNNQSHYAPTPGIIELRQAIVKYYQKYQQIDLYEDQLIITAGASEALSLAIVGLLNEGDKVLFPTPGFPHYEGSIALAGAEVIHANTAHSNFLLTAEDLAQYLVNEPKIKMLILNYPSNPLGTTYTKAEIQALAEVIKKYDILVLSDEIYADLTYEVEHYSIYNEIPKQTLLIAGASKSFAMTGLRIGFIHASTELVEPLYKTHQVYMTCLPTPNQYAAVEAYQNSHDAVMAMKNEYDKRRRLIQKRMSAMGLDVGQPDGAFYVFPTIPQTYGSDDWGFCLALAEKAKVGVLPGSMFGPGGEGHFRFSYAANIEDIEKAMDRMAVFMASLN